MDLANLEGAGEVISWFGYMPSFHDAEVLEVTLRRHGESSIALQFWHTSNQLDSNGCFVLTKHAVISFKLSDVTDVSLSDFSCQNVISGVELEQVGAQLELELLPCFGMFGKITAGRIRLELKPGKRE